MFNNINNSLKEEKQKTMRENEYQLMLLNPKVAKRAMYGCFILAIIVIFGAILLAK